MQVQSYQLPLNTQLCLQLASEPATGNCSEISEHLLQPRPGVSLYTTPNYTPHVLYGKLALNFEFVSYVANYIYESEKT